MGWRSCHRGQLGQASVEWIGLVLLVSLALAGLLAAGVTLPGASLGRAVGGRILCGVSFEGYCGQVGGLVSAYGSEVAGIAREQAPSLAYEDGMRAVPVDYRRCREPVCADGPPSGLVTRSVARRPVVAFVHAVDCRAGKAAETEAAGGDCSGSRRGSLYLEYWTYYADSATLRGVPVAGSAGFHQDDWEGAEIRIGPDGEVSERASSHHGFNYEQSRWNWGSDAGIDVLRDLSELVGARPEGGWGPRTGWLFVSGGSHAGNAKADPSDIDRFTPGRRLLLVPLEPIAAGGDRTRFAIPPPWRKKLWRDPEATGPIDPGSTAWCERAAPTWAASAGRRRGGSSPRSASGW